MFLWNCLACAGHLLYTHVKPFSHICSFDKAYVCGLIGEFLYSLLVLQLSNPLRSARRRVPFDDLPDPTREYGATLVQEHARYQSGKHVFLSINQPHLLPSHSEPYCFHQICCVFDLCFDNCRPCQTAGSRKFKCADLMI